MYNWGENICNLISAQELASLVHKECSKNQKQENNSIKMVKSQEETSSKKINANMQCK